MNILEALEAGLIRYSYGSVFTATDAGGRFIAVDSLEQVARIRDAAEVKYVGAVFVDFSEELPDSVPLDCPDHCWAEAVKSGDWMAHQTGSPAPRPIGALVSWSSAEAEGRLPRPR